MIKISRFLKENLHIQRKNENPTKLSFCLFPSEILRFLLILWEDLDVHCYEELEYQFLE